MRVDFGSHTSIFMVIRYTISDQEAIKMESRDIGIGIVMIVPSFVGSGAVWQFTHSWWLVFLWIIAMVCVYGGILKKKYSSD